MSQPAPQLPSHADFRRVVGDEFSAAESGDALTLTLVSCSDELRSGGYSTFSLGFRSAEPSARPQSTFELMHPTLGELHLFLVPNRADAAGTEYTASFNSLEA